MGGSGETEVSDVMVVLEDEPGMTMKDAAEKLRQLGLIISDMDEENDVIEGTIDAGKVKSLQTLPFVKYVRNLFTYTSDFPGSSPTDEDGESDVDDAAS